jgi:hypothetical protein
VQRGVVCSGATQSRGEKQRFPRLSTGCRWLHQQGGGSPYTTVSRPIVYKQKRRFVLHFRGYVSSSCLFSGATASARLMATLFNFWNPMPGLFWSGCSTFFFFFSDDHGLSEASQKKTNRSLS